MNFILNGQATGNVASVLMANNFDPNALRPFIGKDGRQYITQLDINGKPEVKFVGNANATLRKDDWIQLDTAIIKAAKPRLKAFGDLRAAGLTYSIPNGMGKTVLQHEDMSDITPAVVSMDGMRQSEGDRPIFDLKNLPLPIVHKDFSFSARQVMASRNSGTPLDTSSAELAARRVAEEVEKLTLGVSTAYAFGGGTIYGFENYTSRLTKSMTAPTGSNGNVTLQEVLAMRTQAQDAYHYGPWMLYASTTWDAHLDDDYSDSKGSNTLRQRLAAIEGIQGVRTLDYLTDNTMILVQMTSDVVRAVIGMDITTLQWETMGGMQLNYKVMAILVPQLRADHNGNTGIVHGTHA